MPKNRHLTFGDMQAQKARELHLSKLRAMTKPAETAEQPAETDTPAPIATAKTAQQKAAAKSGAAKKPTSNATPKKAAAKKDVAKKGKK